MKVTDEMVEAAIQANTNAKLFNYGGPKDWVRAALEAALAAAPEPVGVAPGDWAFFLTRLDGLAEKNDTLFKQAFNEFKANVTMGKKK